MDKYTVKDLRILGISREKAQDWIARGYISSSIEKASGKGAINIFSRWDMYGIRLFMDFLERGISRWQAAEYLASWTEYTKYKSISNKDHMNYAVIRFADVDRRPKSERENVNLLPGHLYRSELQIFENFDDFDLQSYIKNNIFKQNLMIINIREIIKYVDKKLAGK